MILNELSIADCKSAIDFIKELKNDRMELLKSQGLDSKDDDAYNSLNKLQFDIRNSLFKRIMKMRKEL